MPAKTPTMNLVPVETALVSVYDKTGLLGFIGSLHMTSPRLRVISSGGTYEHLQPQSRDLGYGLTEVSEYTGFPESPKGLVKTLHPRVHGGLLLDFDDPEHAAYANKNGIIPIDLVVVNLYPFKETVRATTDWEERREKIDIGGPSMVRAAAKNFRRVAVVTNPGKYRELVESLIADNGATSLVQRFRLAREAFRHTRDYDIAITKFMDEVPDESVPEYYL